ncbi:MAG: MarR family winged helix-turn-helix transcriptional regulator [Janthinobacterium lividum]
MAWVKGDSPDLTNRQMALLMIVCLEPGQHTVRGLAARLGVAKPVISRVLDKLCGIGYVMRKTDPGDRRNIFVVPTGSGAEFLDSFAGNLH